MNIGTLFRIAILLCTVSVGPLASADLVTLIGPDITPAPDNRISTITGVTIAGTANDGLFDLTFHHGISYDTLQAKLGSMTSPISWTTDAEAGVVLAAIRAAVTSFGDVDGEQTNNVSIPLVELPAVVTAKLGLNQVSASYSSWFSDTPLPGKSGQHISLQSNDAWVTATTAVPEPSAFFYLGLVGLGFVVRQTRKANRETK